MNALHAGIVIKSLLKTSRVNEDIEGRIYPVIAQDVPYPFVVYARTGVAPSGSKDHFSDEDSATVMVSVIAAKYEESIQIADKIEASLRRRRTTIEGFEISEIRLIEADEDFQNGAYIQNLVFTIDFINN